MWILRWIFLLLIIFFLVGFLSQNSADKVMIRFMGWESAELPLAFMLFLAALTGYILSMIVAVANQLKLRGQLAQMRRENRQVREELDRLRNFALEEENDEVSVNPEGSST